MWLAQGRRQGSPPQVRGKHNAYYIRNNPLRITPAGAGKTATMPLKRYLTQDHPRRCGENSNIREYANLIGGSPPQVRGKLDDSLFAVKALGITPAGAGKTAPPQRTRRNAWDHPRRCGENGRRTKKRGVRRGSPPQVRGKQIKGSTLAGAYRITPAGAGKTISIAMI